MTRAAYFILDCLAAIVLIAGLPVVIALDLADDLTRGLRSALFMGGK